MKINSPLPGLTKVDLLEALKKRTLEDTAEMLLPVRPQKNDDGVTERNAGVYIGGMREMAQSTKKAPYILHRMVNSASKQEPGERLQTKAIVRSIFCVYCDDEEEGELLLMSLMERLRISLLRNPLIGDDQFECSTEEGLEDLVYPDNTHPYYLGEMLTVWDMPEIKREVRYW